MTLNTNLKISSVLNRFGKGILAGAIASIGMVTLAEPSVWLEWTPLLNTVAKAGVYGGFTGLLLALQKWASWKEDLYL